MISTSLSEDERYVVHTAKGSLDLADIGQAALDASDRVLPVLWDFSDAILAAPDAFYRAGSGAVLNKLEQTAQRRAFLVGSQTHLERVTGVVQALAPPWCWKIFMDRQAAVDWLVEVEED